jgi:hypothetical protein
MIGIGIVNVNCTSLFSSVALGFLVIFPSYHACPRLRLRSNDFLLLLFSFLFHPCYSINCCRKFSFFSLSMSSISPTSSDHLLRRSIHTHARVVSGMYFTIIMIVRFIKCLGSISLLTTTMTTTAIYNYICT